MIPNRGPVMKQPTHDLTTPASTGEHCSRVRHGVFRDSHAAMVLCGSHEFFSALLNPPHHPAFTLVHLVWFVRQWLFHAVLASATFPCFAVSHHTTPHQLSFRSVHRG